MSEGDHHPFDLDRLALADALGVMTRYLRDLHQYTTSRGQCVWCRQDSPCDASRAADVMAAAADWLENGELGELGQTIRDQGLGDDIALLARNARYWADQLALTHRRKGDSDWCSACTSTWPCDTQDSVDLLRAAADMLESE